MRNLTDELGAGGILCTGNTNFSTQVSQYSVYIELQDFCLI